MTSESRKLKALYLQAVETKRFQHRVKLMSTCTALPLRVSDTLEAYAASVPTYPGATQSTAPAEAVPAPATYVPATVRAEENDVGPKRHAGGRRRRRGVIGGVDARQRAERGPDVGHRPEPRALLAASSRGDQAAGDKGCHSHAALEL